MHLETPVFTRLHINEAMHSIAVFGNLICKLTDTRMQINRYRLSQGNIEEGL